MSGTQEHEWKSRHPNDGLSRYGADHDASSVRDVVGYGKCPPDPLWPNGAKVALNLVVNYEEGGERCLLHGDGESEALLSEIVGAAPYSELRVRSSRR